MFSNKQLVALSIPVIIDAFLFMLVGLADSTMVASVGPNAVTAVSLVDSIAAFFLLVQNSLSAGGGIVAAQYIGKGDHESACRTTKQTVYISLIYTTLAAVVLIFSGSGILRLVYQGLDKDVMEYCNQYFFWILLGFPVYAIGNTCATMLRAQTNTKLALYIAGTVNILNVIGNAILIYGFDMGIRGAAISTTLSRFFYAIFGILALRIPDAPIYIKNIFKVRFEKDLLKKVLRIGIASGIEGGLSQLGFILVSVILASLGPIAVTVCNVSGKFGNLAWSLVASLQLVLMTVVGQCIGAGEIEQAKMYTKKFMRYANIAIIVSFVLLSIFSYQLVSIYALDEDILRESAKQLVFAGFFTVTTFYARCSIPFSAFRAAGDTRFSVVVSLIGMFAGRVLCSYIFAILLGLGVTGIWIGMGANHLICALFATIRLRSGKWLTKKVV